MDLPCAEKYFGRAWAQWLKLRILTSQFFMGWTFAIVSVVWLIISAEDSSSTVLDVLQPVFYFVSSLFMLQFAYKEGTMFDSVLFGCHKASTLPDNHPMGPMFNAEFNLGIDIEAGLDAAQKVMDLAWDELEEGVWINE